MISRRENFTDSENINSYNTPSSFEPKVIMVVNWGEIKLFISCGINFAGMQIRVAHFISAFGAFI
jgi:hypothetical protein